MLGNVGSPVSVEDLQYGPILSLVKQKTDVWTLVMLNLAGIGVMVWDDRSVNPDQPLVYRNTHVAVFGRNFRDLAGKVRARPMLAHVRNVPSNSTA